MNETSENSKKHYKRKHRMFGVWLPKDIYEWFIQYLKRKSLGSTTSEQFRQFLYHLKRKEETGVTSAMDKLVTSAMDKLVTSVKPVIPTSPVSPTTKEWICLWNKPQHPNPDQQAIRCQTCKRKDFARWQACQKLKTEA